MVQISQIVPRLPRFLRRHRAITFWLSLTGERPVQLVRFFEEHRALLDLRDGFNRLVLIDGSYDNELLQIAKPFLTSGGHYLDIGANCGMTSFGLCTPQTQEHCTFHLFEANPDLIPILHETAQHYESFDLRIVHGCISSKPGTSRLCRRIEHTGAAYVGEEGDVAVNNLCLDDYIAKNKIERIPLAKIDIEGFELHAMRGMRDSMEKGLVEAVILEIAPPWLNRQGHRPADIFEFLADTGYRCFFFRSDDPNRSSESARVEVHGTVLHVYPVEHALIEGQTDIIAFHESIYSNRITDHASG